MSLFETLTQLVATYGLSAVLQELINVCWAKSEQPPHPEAALGWKQDADTLEHAREALINY